MNYNFKQITSIPGSKQLIDIVLSKTQRKTPTVVHNGYAIGRIRAFYMRKVKYTQDTIREKLTGILEGFPKLEDIHPFFSDLINVLYDKDHYKLALGHVNSCRNLVDNIAKDYVRLLKYADSLYRSKQLKKAALGRMCTILKKLTSSLNYLEEVRKHLARLPSINPFERTLMLTGFPNVGKSSFINNISNTNADVQPYPFTTQALHVGHTDYEYLRWQVIDSPGILDHSLEERNTIEMQSITALAHLKACILYFIDISEMCGHTIPDQINLFNSIKALFKNKPHLIVLTKTDLKPVNEIAPENLQALEALAQESGISLVAMSNKNGEGIGEVKAYACQQLMKFRDQQSVEAVSGGNQVIKSEEQYNRGLYIAQPKKKRGNVDRPTYIPESVKQGKQPLNRPTQKQIQEQYGGAGVYDLPLQEHFMLEKEEWKYDFVPEIMDGKNIADFVDKDILQKLDALEQEEEMMLKAQNEEEGDMEEEDEDLEYNEQIEGAYKEICTKRAQLKLEHKLKRHTAKNIHQNKMSDLKKNLPKTADIEKIERDRTTSQKNKRRARDMEDVMEDLGNDMEDDSDNMDIEGNISEKFRARSVSKHKQKRTSLSRSRTKGFKQEKSATEKAMERVKFKIDKQWQGRAGEADRAIGTKMPKHQFSGKQGFSRQRR